MVISGKKPNFGRQDTRDTKTRHIHVTETMRHSTPSAPSTTLRPRWSLNSEHSVFNTLYISWRQNWDFGDKTQIILEKEKILWGQFLEELSRIGISILSESFLVTISRGQNELPRVGETTQEVSTGQFAWMAHSFVVYTEHNHHRHHRHHHNHHSFVVYLVRGSHLIWKSIAMGWEINGMGNLTSLDKAPRLAFILIQYLSNSITQQILGQQCYLAFSPFYM